MRLKPILEDGNMNVICNSPVTGVPSSRRARGWKNWLGQVSERVNKRHFQRYGGYFRLRTFLPLFALAFVWLPTTPMKSPFQVQALVNSSVTFRHLLLGMITATLWCVLGMQRSRRKQSSSRELTSEAYRLVRNSFLCGFALFLGVASHSGFYAGSRLALYLTTGFLVGSTLLLSSSIFLSAEMVPFTSEPRKAIIIGSGQRARSIRALAESVHARLDILGCLDNEYVGLDSRRDHYMGGLSLLPNLLKEEPIELVLIGLPVRSCYEEIQHVINVCESVGVESHYMQDVFATTRNVHQTSASLPEFAVLADPPNVIGQAVKRLFDILISGVLLLLASPILLLIVIAIKATDFGPAFFVQERYGKNRQRFRMYKFRTMVVDAEARQAALEHANETGGPTFKLKSDPRVTRIGAFLRKTSLDELPQLVNVLQGEMSLVGPRPLPLRDVSRFESAWLLRRFSALPGLTCLWQVRGRSNTTFDDWMKFDLEYIDNWSLSLDFLILAQTIPAVLRGSGAV